MSWNPYLIALIAASASVDYVVARCLERMTAPRWRRCLLCLSIAVNLGLLAFFKYTNFLLGSARSAAGWFGGDLHGPVLSLVLPLGISFYTFETISYVVDVYRGRTRAVRSLLDYALYIMFFPHLVAGPIVRPRDFLPQLRRRKRFSWDRLQVGVQFFLLGLFKKAVLADHLARVVDPVFAQPGLQSSGSVWLATLAYAVQIYCDFSGYSDMAVGLAHTLGFRLPLNFNMPYFSADITEFWRRWHISLSSWLRDYLYIPLGGSRHGRWATYRNLLVTMLLGGLWHGASWTFVLWGLYHGLLLALERCCPLPEWLRQGLFRPLRVACTFLAVSVGWVLFRAQSFADAGALLARLVSPTAGLSLGPARWALVGTCLALVLAGHLVGTFVNVKRLERRLPAPVLGSGMAFVVLLLFWLVAEDSRAFIYFQF
jgi:alginate O-acetyltransferase complex protein AlgI